jgi:hypothetical protein
MPVILANNVVLEPIPDPSLPEGIDPITVVGVEDMLSIDNCPIINKKRTIIVPQGRTSTMRWVMRDRNGNPLDLSGAMVGDPVGSVVARFRHACSNNKGLDQIIGTSPVSQTGEVFIPLEDSIANILDYPGMYEFSIAVAQGDGTVVAVDNGFMFVERSLFGDTTNPQSGPLSLSEVTIQLRDTLYENSLHGQPEFDDTEIIHSIIKPIQEWNEIPPNVYSTDCWSFPWRKHWLDATVANLLVISAGWYMRNKLQVQSGGLQDNDLNKDNPYLMLSQMYKSEWKDFVERKKVEINMGLAAGELNSTYSYGFFR